MLDKTSRKYLAELEDRLWYVEQYNSKFASEFFRIDINDYLMRYLDSTGLSGYIPKSIYYGNLKGDYQANRLSLKYIINLFKELELI